MDSLLESSRWKDKYSQQGLESPPIHWETVTPHAVDKLSKVCRVIFVGVPGDLEVQNVEGEIIIFKNCPAGYEAKGFWVRVGTNSTGSSAGDYLAGE
ncbi:MAG: hypothetical protein HOK41_05095 [Nitrospina sp.]|jgi:hypothetical protein|nr:hypothetical protein [Nitrospina sp.]